MILILSGEGKTDLGQTVPGRDGMAFQPGPMAKIVDQLLEKAVGYSLLDSDAAGGKCVRFVSETELGNMGKPGPMRLPGLKTPKGNSFFARNAQTLGLCALREERARNDVVIAVLFRDGDGTSSTSPREWQEKLDSITNGFALANFGRGVPMVPRPKSEAWLICALKNNPYRDCAKLEDESGNDRSPNSLKFQLEQLVGHSPSAEEQATWLDDGKVDPLHIDMPSFHAFRKELDRAAKLALK